MHQLPFSWNLLRSTNYALLSAATAQTIESASWLDHKTLEGNMSAIPNPVQYPLPVEKPSTKPDSVINPKHKVLIAIGRLTAQRQLDILIRSFSNL